jgi:hypothetical protein
MIKEKIRATILLLFLSGSFVSCKNEMNGNDNLSEENTEQIKITIKNISDIFMDNDIVLLISRNNLSYDALGGEHNINGTVHILLEKPISGKAWTQFGEYYMEINITVNDFVHGYKYTDGGTLDNIVKYNITNTISKIDFSKFAYFDTKHIDDF